MVCFLFGHVLYVFGFHHDQSGQESFVPTLAAPFALLGAFVFAALRRRLGNLQVPVLIYIAVITLMGYTAARRVSNWGEWSWDGERKSAASSEEMMGKSELHGLLGALTFLVSDIVLAFNKFRHPLVGAKWVVMSTYYAAQIGIASAAMLHVPDE